MGDLGGGDRDPAPSVRSLAEKVEQMLDHFKDEDQKGEELLSHSSFSLLVAGGAARPPP
jgi:hypothetical protein